MNSHRPLVLQPFYHILPSSHFPFSFFSTHRHLIPPATPFSMADHDTLISNFCELTSASAQQVRRFTASAALHLLPEPLPATVARQATNNRRPQNTLLPASGTSTRPLHPTSPTSRKATRPPHPAVLPPPQSPPTLAREHWTAVPLPSTPPNLPRLPRNPRSAPGSPP